MDIITYTDNDNTPHMLFEDSKPTVVMGMEGATVVLDDTADDGKCFLHIRKENGVTLTLVMTFEETTELSKSFLNMYRVGRGLPKIDVDELMRKAFGGEDE